MFASTDNLTVRVASDEDRHELQRLAELDSARPLTHPVLVGELDGACVAAVSLHDGRQVADPFRLTGDVAALLRTRASQLAA